MKIIAENLGKKYHQRWIFKDLKAVFEGKSYCIQGGNGQGKSTLIEILSGFTSATQGDCHYFLENKPISKNQIFTQVAVAAPALELWENFSVLEILNFHFAFKPMRCQKAELLEKLAFNSQTLQMPIFQFSSGMKQRLKLALAIFAQAPFLFLDEPTAYLDGHWSKKYQQWLLQNLNNRLVFIASNEQNQDFSFLPCLEVFKL